MKCKLFTYKNANDEYKTKSLEEGDISCAYNPLLHVALINIFR